MGVSSGTNALMDDLVELGSGLDGLKAGLRKLDSALDANEPSAVLAAMKALRTTVDTLEHKVADKRWPLPKYRDMLFLY
jgi:glutamine synthetase